MLSSLSSTIITVLGILPPSEDPRSERRAQRVRRPRLAAQERRKASADPLRKGKYERPAGASGASAKFSESIGCSELCSLCRRKQINAEARAAGSNPTSSPDVAAKARDRSRRTTARRLRVARGLAARRSPRGDRRDIHGAAAERDVEGVAAEEIDQSDEDEQQRRFPALRRAE